MAHPMHEAFDWIFFKLMPDAPPEAIVYEVDGGGINTPSVVIRAAVFEGGTEPTGAILAGPFEKVIAKGWLLEQADARRAASPGRTARS